MAAIQVKRVVDLPGGGRFIFALVPLVGGLVDEACAAGCRASPISSTAFFLEVDCRNERELLLWTLWQLEHDIEESHTR